MTDPINRNYTAWYCGDITRQQAEDILRREDLPRISNNFCDRNVFLLRHASKFEKDGVPPFSQYVLSCRFNNNHCDHYRIFYHRTALTGYPASAIGFYIETSQNHHSGHDFIGNTEELEENLKMGQIELQIKDPVTGEQNKRPMKCFPITRTYDMPVAPEKNSHNNIINNNNLTPTPKTPPRQKTSPNKTPVLNSKNSTPKNEEYHDIPQELESPKNKIINPNPPNPTISIDEKFKEKSGWLQVTKKNLVFNSEQRLYCTLTKNSIEYYNVPPEINANKDPIDRINFSDILEVLSNDKKDRNFVLKVANKTDLKFKCENKKERDQWFELIRERKRWIDRNGNIAGV